MSTNQPTDSLLPSDLQGQKPAAIMNLQVNTQLQDKLILLLTNLYQNPIAATVREVISNAIDATLQIPQDQRQPIQIHVPSQQEPFFMVTDHALGMSTDEIKNIYLNYGNSTKTQDSQQIGSYGLGAKAPLSYTQSFLVTTVKDQQQTMCLIDLKAAQQAQIYTQATQEANRTTVKVPLPSVGQQQIKDIDEFRKCLFTYAQTPVTGIQFTGLENINPEVQNNPYCELINCGTFSFSGQQLPVYYQLQLQSQDNQAEEILTQITAFIKVMNLGCLTDNHWDEDSDFPIEGALMGYRYDLTLYPKHTQHGHFIIDLKPGLVNFSSSRDTVTHDDKLSALLQTFRDNCPQLLINQIKQQGFYRMMNASLTQAAIQSIWHLVQNPNQHVSQLWHSDSLFQKQVFTTPKGVDLSALALKPLAIIDNQDRDINQNTQGSKKLTQFYALISKRMQDAQLRPSLWHIFDYYQKQIFPAHGHLNVFYGMHTLSVIKKIVSQRKQKVLQDPQASWTITLVFKEDQDQIQIALEHFKTLFDQVSLSYRNETEVRQLICPPRTHQKTPLSLEPLTQIEINSGSHFLEILEEVQDGPSSWDNSVPPQLTLGIIQPRQKLPDAILDHLNEVIPALLLSEKKDPMLVNIYTPKDLKLHNLPAFKQQNDFILCLSNPHSDKVKQALQQLRLPAYPQIPAQSPDMIINFIYWVHSLWQMNAWTNEPLHNQQLLAGLWQLHILRYNPGLTTQEIQDEWFEANIDPLYAQTSRITYDDVIKQVSSLQPFATQMIYNLNTQQLHLQSTPSAEFKQDFALVSDFLNLTAQKTGYNSLTAYVAQRCVTGTL